MKKITSLFLLIFLLFSCNIKENNNFNKKELEIKNINNEIELKVFNKNDLEDLKNFFIENKKVDSLYILLDYYDDNYYEVFKNLPSFEKLQIDFWNGVKNIEKTLNVLKNNLNYNNWLTLDFLDKRNFSNRELEILSEFNLKILEIHWVYPRKKYKNNKELSEKYLHDIKDYDNKIINLLSKSAKFKKIIILDYKIFEKDNTWKVNIIKDLRTK